MTEEMYKKLAQALIDGEPEDAEASPRGLHQGSRKLESSSQAANTFYPN
jgi:hypothetical protein